MRKVNVDRMRKYSAKNARDYLEVEIDRKYLIELSSEDYEDYVRFLLAPWVSKMKRKHGEDVSIKVHSYYDELQMKYTIRAEVVRA